MAVAMAVAWTMMATAVRAPMTRATMLARRTVGTWAASGPHSSGGMRRCRPAWSWA